MKAAHNMALFLVTCILFAGSSVVGQNLKLVSVNKNGNNGGDQWSYHLALSGNGRYVAFTSEADDLVSVSDSNGQPDIFLRDLWTGTTTLVSVNNKGTAACDRGAATAAISGDGRFVVFTSDATDLLDTPVNSFADQIYVRDMVLGKTMLVSVSADHNGVGNSSSESPAVSADGRVIAFISLANNLVANDTNNAADVFAFDLSTKGMTLVSVAKDGMHSGNKDSGDEGSSGIITPVISADGSIIAFVSNATDLADIQDDNNGADVFARDLLHQTTYPISVKGQEAKTGNDYSKNPSMSSDGRYVGFFTQASDILEGQDATQSHFYVRDLSSGKTIPLPYAGQGVFSADGHYVAFSGDFNEAVPIPDTNNRPDIYVRDMQTGVVTPVSINSTGTATGNGESGLPAISGDGRYVVFDSQSTDLVATSDSGPQGNIFLRDLQSGTTTLISLNRNGSGGGNSYSQLPQISSSGQAIAFESNASNFGDNDTNKLQDIYAFAPNVPTLGPKITGASISGKNLIVEGQGFDNGAAILLNNEREKTKNDTAVPTTRLIGKKVGKRIAQGQAVTLVVRNSDGTTSDPFTFTRPN